MLAYSTSIIAFAYACFRKQDFNLPNFEAGIRSRRRNSLEKKYGHDVQAYQEMNERIESYRKELAFLK
jgi:hypothetical protein